MIEFGQSPADTYPKFCQYRGIVVRSIEHDFRRWLTDSELLYDDRLELLRIQSRFPSFFPTAPEEYQRLVQNLQDQHTHRLALNYQEERRASRVHWTDMPHMYNGLEPRWHAA